MTHASKYNVPTSPLRSHSVHNSASLPIPEQIQVDNEAVFLRRTNVRPSSLQFLKKPNGEPSLDFKFSKNNSNANRKIDFRKTELSDINNHKINLHAKVANPKANDDVTGQSAKRN